MPKAVDNTARRKWDREEFEERAEARRAEEGGAGEGGEEEGGDGLTLKQRKQRERDPLHLGLIERRSALRGRDVVVDVGRAVGRKQVVSLGGDLRQQGGFYCSVCDCRLADSQSYLDHINGKRHHRLLGMSMKTERANVEQVKDRLKVAAERRKRPQLSAGEDYDARLAKLMEEDEKLRESRKRRKLERNRAAQEEKKQAAQAQKAAEEEGMDPEMLAMMGFSGFGGGK